MPSTLIRGSCLCHMFLVFLLTYVSVVKEIPLWSSGYIVVPYHQRFGVLIYPWSSGYIVVPYHQRFGVLIYLGLVVTSLFLITKGLEF